MSVPKPRKPEVHNAQSPEHGMTRRTFLKAAAIGAGISLFAGSGLGSIFGGKALAADKKKPVILAQAESNPAIRKELNSLQRVSYNEMIRIENESEKTCQQGITDEPKYYGMILNIPVSGQKWSIVAHVSIGYQDATTFNNGAAIKVFDKNGKAVWYNIDFTKLSALYKEATGQEMKYVKILGEYGKDNAGEYINIHFVPINESKGRVQTGTPAIACTYSNGTLDSAYYSIS